ncbi:MAG: cation:proton antiporter [Cyanobacteriota bacterium]|nr:cation:proton antiporter [Cyanobacteriota bacterium]
MESSPLVKALLALVVIIAVAQLLGALAHRIGQPRVMGDIIGGILLGPSLLGAVAPDAFGWLFSGEVRSQINLLAQLGLVLFMFLVGLEINPRILRQRLPLASRLSLVGVVLPMVLGVGLAAVLEGWLPELIPGDHTLQGVLFMGVAMAITAFPVLARILAERQLLGQPLGILAISAASIDDVVGWSLLAVVSAYSRTGSVEGGLPVLVGTALYGAALLLATAPLRRWLTGRLKTGHPPGELLQTLLLLGALLSGLITEVIGVHLIFGAFLWGLALPREESMRQWLEVRLETVVLRLLLPLFFAISGLNTQLGSLHTLNLWLATGLVVATAVAGKFLGVWGVARWSRVPPREAEALGWLMNTRGLTELVVLNVGLALGVISGELFTMGVLMALLTTAMAGPMLDRLGYGRGADPVVL